MNEAESIVYFNGRFIARSSACVSVLDRGFLFGDGVYEVIPVYGHRPFEMPAHLRRLSASLEAIRIDNPLSDAEWSSILGKLIAGSPTNDQLLYIQVSRGAAETRDHGFPGHISPTVFARASPMPLPEPGLEREGVAAITAEDTRWSLCHIKAITLLPNVLLRQRALDAGCVEAILVRNGEVTEGAASNVFLVTPGGLITPPKSAFILSGITRQVVIELATEAGVPVQERAVRFTELTSAQEIWLTSSSREIIPVTRLDGRVVADGRPGALWKKLRSLFDEYKRRG